MFSKQMALATLAILSLSGAWSGVASAADESAEQARVKAEIKAHPERYPGIDPNDIRIVSRVQVPVADSSIAESAKGWSLDPRRKSPAATQQKLPGDPLKRTVLQGIELNQVVNTTLVPPAPSCSTCTESRTGRPWYRNLWIVSGALIGAQVATDLALSALPKETTGWEKGGFDVMLRSAKLGPHFDNDHWTFNYLAHPLAGSEYYLIARNRDANWWQSTLYSIAASTFWEYVTEGYYERPSIQDLIITPLSGAILGEARYQAKKSLLDKDGRARGWRKVFVIVLDPMDALSGGSY